MYISKFYDRNGEEVVVSNSITKEHVAEIQEAILHIRQFLNESDHYITVCEDAKEFLTFLQDTKSDAELEFIQTNRYFSNYLNAFYTWGCFHNHSNSWFLNEEYKKIRAGYQDQSAIYVLAKHLRDYTTHNGFAINEIRFDVLNEVAYYNITTHFFEHAGSKANRKIKLYLDSTRAEGIEAREFTENFLEMFKEFQMKIWKEALCEVYKAIDVLLSVAAPNAPDCYNTYIVDNCNCDFFLNIGRFLELFSKRIKFLETAI